MADNNQQPQQSQPVVPTVVVNTVPQRFNWSALKGPLFNLLFFAAIGFGVYKQWFDPNRGTASVPNQQLNGNVKIDINEFKSFGKCYSESIKKCQCAIDISNQCSQVGKQ